MPSSKRFLNGLLLLNKPANMSSFSAVSKVKYLFNAKKAGHTGSLDLLATGLLPICFGKATRLARFLLDDSKMYEVEVTLGVTRDTEDEEGSIQRLCSVSHIQATDIEKALEALRGPIKQIPPMLSALKYKGQPLYRLARQGIEIDRESRDINIYSNQLLNFSKNKVRLFVHCSKGTYIRSLAISLGESLQVGANVAKLNRIQVGDYLLENAFSIQELEAIYQEKGLEGLDSCLIGSDSILASLKKVMLDHQGQCFFENGRPIFLNDQSSETIGMHRVYSIGNKFLGVGLMENQVLSPKIVF